MVDTINKILPDTNANVGGLNSALSKGRIGAQTLALREGEENINRPTEFPDLETQSWLPMRAGWINHDLQEIAIRIPDPKKYNKFIPNPHDSSKLIPNPEKPDNFILSWRKVKPGDFDPQEGKFYDENNGWVIPYSNRNGDISLTPRSGYELGLVPGCVVRDEFGITWVSDMNSGGKCVPARPGLLVGGGIKSTGDKLELVTPKGDEFIWATYDKGRLKGEPRFKWELAKSKGKVLGRSNIPTTPENFERFLGITTHNFDPECSIIALNAWAYYDKENGSWRKARNGDKSIAFDSLGGVIRQNDSNMQTQFNNDWGSENPPAIHVWCNDRLRDPNSAELAKKRGTMNYDTYHPYVRAGMTTYNNILPVNGNENSPGRDINPWSDELWYSAPEANRIQMAIAVSRDRGMAGLYRAKWAMLGLSASSTFGAGLGYAAAAVLAMPAIAAVAPMLATLAIPIGVAAGLGAALGAGYTYDRGLKRQQFLGSLDKYIKDKRPDLTKDAQKSDIFGITESLNGSSDFFKMAATEIFLRTGGLSGERRNARKAIGVALGGIAVAAGLAFLAAPISVIAIPVGVAVLAYGASTTSTIVNRVGRKFLDYNKANIISMESTRIGYSSEFSHIGCRIANKDSQPTVTIKPYEAKVLNNLGIKQLPYNLYSNPDKYSNNQIAKILAEAENQPAQPKSTQLESTRWRDNVKARDSKMSIAM